MILQIEALTVRYGARAVLNDIALTVAPGEVLALIGPNGAGKTTLFRTISGVIRPASGAIRVAEEEITRLSVNQRARFMAVVPQARRLPADFTVWQTVLLGRTPHLGWLGKSTPGDQQRARWALERTNLLDLAGRRIDELSGGEQQLVLLARALAQETPILLLDEPTAHLDLKHQSHLLRLVQELAHEQQLAILMAIHDLNLVALYADRVALLSSGRLLAMGTAGEVLTPEALARVYQVPLYVLPHPIYGTPLVLLDGHDQAGVRSAG
jgi:iron complex transport system ATP-binding protein